MKRFSRPFTIAVAVVLLLAFFGVPIAATLFVSRQPDPFHEIMSLDNLERRFQSRDEYTRLGAMAAMGQRWPSMERHHYLVLADAALEGRIPPEAAGIVHNIARYRKGQFEEAVFSIIAARSDMPPPRFPAAQWDLVERALVQIDPRYGELSDRDESSRLDQWRDIYVNRSQ